jgi:hypothetical protein
MGDKEIPLSSKGLSKSLLAFVAGIREVSAVIRFRNQALVIQVTFQKPSSITTFLEL